MYNYITTTFFHTSTEFNINIRSFIKSVLVFKVYLPNNDLNHQIPLVSAGASSDSGGGSVCVVFFSLLTSYPSSVAFWTSWLYISSSRWVCLHSIYTYPNHSFQITNLKFPNPNGWKWYWISTESPLNEIRTKKQQELEMEMETYPEITPGRLTYQSILIIIIKIQHPVITCNRYDGQKWWNVEFHLQFRFIAFRISFISSSFNESSLATTPSLV